MVRIISLIKCELIFLTAWCLNLLILKMILCKNEIQSHHGSEYQCLTDSKNSVKERNTGLGL